MRECHLKVIHGGKDTDELIVAMLRALQLANSCRSETTSNLLRMALLNEGVELAKALKR